VIFVSFFGNFFLFDLHVFFLQSEHVNVYTPLFRNLSTLSVECLEFKRCWVESHVIVPYAIRKLVCLKSSVTCLVSFPKRQR
jgi:hypothetical protein